MTGRALYQPTSLSAITLVVTLILSTLIRNYGDVYSHAAIR
jgi:hypothetical protein